MRNFIVTGANRGIGLALVKKILNEVDDSFVFLGSRNEARGQNAIENILKEKPELKDRVELLVIDIGEKNSIKSAAQKVETKLNGRSKLDGIVNNAAVFVEDAEETFRVNVYGMKLVLEDFEHLLQENASIVNVSSVVGSLFVRLLNSKSQTLFINEKVEWSQLEDVMKSAVDNFSSNFDANEFWKAMGLTYEKINNQLSAFGMNNVDEQAKKSFVAYLMSKALVNSLTLYQARQHPQFKINSVALGMVDTDMAGGFFGAGIVATVARTVEQGANPLFYVLTADLE